MACPNGNISICVYCSFLGISEDSITFDPFAIRCVKQNLTVGAVLELNKFCSTKKIHHNSLPQWLSQGTGNSADAERRKITRLLNFSRRNKGQRHQEKRRRFFQTPYFLAEGKLDEDPQVPCERPMPKPFQPAPKPKKVKPKLKENRDKNLRRREIYTRNQNKILKKKNRALINQLEVTKQKVICEQNKKNHWKKKCQQKKTKPSVTIPSASRDSLRDFEDIELDLKDEQAYSTNLRLLVLELISLEVPTANIPLVIQAVADKLFRRTISLTDLPSRQTVLNISDEGQALIKMMYCDKLSQAESFGIHKDGTSKQKKKISDISIRTEDDSMPLGFIQLARETGIAIKNTVVDGLEELAALSALSIQDLANKYTYNMSDRAANEAVADRELLLWKSQQSQDPNPHLHSFHCTAHVLLGFASYVHKDLKSHFSVEEDRTHLAVRLASDLLGPSADERSGVQDKWSSFCHQKHIKSPIISFKDNRFNAFFKQSAHLVQHLSDVTVFLSLLNSSNFKVVQLQTCLSEPQTVLVLHASALVYLLVTEPFWRLATSSISYLELFSFIQPLSDNISAWVEVPSVFLETLPVAIPDFQPDRSSPLYEAVVTSFTHVDREALCSILSIIFGAISSCLKKQMAEFLPGGTYSTSFSSEDVSSTAGSSLTNLTCERHFGSLDFSLKRRRHASLHYHTTHLLLKSNLSSLSDWLQSKDLVEQLHLWTQAKKAGPYLRKKHQESQIKTVIESFHNVEATTVATPPVQPSEVATLEVNKFVAVAYDNGWFPGEGEKILELFVFLDCFCNFVVPLLSWAVTGVFKFWGQVEADAKCVPFVFTCSLLLFSSNIL